MKKRLISFALALSIGLGSIPLGGWQVHGASADMVDRTHIHNVDTVPQEDQVQVHSLDDEYAPAYAPVYNRRILKELQKLYPESGTVMDDKNDAVHYAVSALFELARRDNCDIYSVRYDKFGYGTPLYPARTLFPSRRDLEWSAEFKLPAANREKEWLKQVIANPDTGLHVDGIIRNENMSLAQIGFIAKKGEPEQVLSGQRYDPFGPPTVVRPHDDEADIFFAETRTDEVVTLAGQFDQDTQIRAYGYSLPGEDHDGSQASVSDLKISFFDDEEPVPVSAYQDEQDPDIFYVTMNENIRYTTAEHDPNLKKGTEPSPHTPYGSYLYIATLDPVSRMRNGKVKAVMEGCNGKTLTFRMDQKTAPKTSYCLGPVLRTESNMGYKPEAYPYTVIGISQYRYKLVQEASHGYLQYMNTRTPMAGPRIDYPFCDAAGNPLSDECMAKFNFGNFKIQVDNGAPQLKSVSISKPLEDEKGQKQNENSWPADLEKSDLYLGKGNYIKFRLNTSERILPFPEAGKNPDLFAGAKLDPKMYVTTNILDKDDKPVILEVFETPSGTWDLSGVHLEEGMHTVGGEIVKLTHLGRWNFLDEEGIRLSSDPNFDWKSGKDLQELFSHQLQRNGQDLPLEEDPNKENFPWYHYGLSNVPSVEQFSVDTMIPSAEAKLVAKQAGTGRDFTLQLDFADTTYTDGGKTTSNGAAGVEGLPAQVALLANSEISTGFDYLVSNEAQWPGNEKLTNTGTLGNTPEKLSWINVNMDGRPKFLHVHLNSSEKLFLDNSLNENLKIQVKAKDWACNELDTAIPVSQFGVLDEVAPEIIIGNPQITYAGNDITITLPEVQVIDGRMDGLTAKYQWSDETDVRELPLTDGKGSISRTVAAAGNSGNLTLSVTATDQAGNSYTTPPRNFAYDNTRPTPVYEMKTNPDQANPHPELMIQGSPALEDKTAWTLVRLYDSTDTLLGSTQIQTGNTLDVFAFDAVWTDGNKQDVTAELKNHYGPVTVKLTTAYGELDLVSGQPLTEIAYWPDAAVISDIRYAPAQNNMYQLNGAFTYEQDGVNLDGSAEDFSIYVQKSQDMNLLKIGFTIENQQKNLGWGLSGLDMDKSSLELVKENSDMSYTVVAASKLAGTETQVYIPPVLSGDGKALSSGAYRLRVNLIQKGDAAGAYLYTTDSAPIVLDGPVQGEIGIWETRFSGYGYINGTDDQKYNYDRFDDKAGAMRLPAVEKTWENSPEELQFALHSETPAEHAIMYDELHFPLTEIYRDSLYAKSQTYPTVLGISVGIRNNPNQSRSFYGRDVAKIQSIKVWNDACTDEKALQWHEVNKRSDTGDYCSLEVRPYTTRELTPNTVEKLPDGTVILYADRNSTNVYHYKFLMSNGEETPKQSFTLNFTSATPDGRVELKPQAMAFNEEKNRMEAGKIQMQVCDVQSAIGDVDVKLLTKTDCQINGEPINRNGADLFFAAFPVNPVQNGQGGDTVLTWGSAVEPPQYPSGGDMFGKQFFYDYESFSSPNPVKMDPNNPGNEWDVTDGYGTLATAFMLTDAGGAVTLLEPQIGGIGSKYHYLPGSSMAEAGASWFTDSKAAADMCAQLTCSTRGARLPMSLFDLDKSTIEIFGDEIIKDTGKESVTLPLSAKAPNGGGYLGCDMGKDGKYFTLHFAEPVNDENPDAPVKRWFTTNLVGRNGETMTLGGTFQSNVQDDLWFMHHASTTGAYLSSRMGTAILYTPNLVYCPKNMKGPFTDEWEFAYAENGTYTTEVIDAYGRPHSITAEMTDCPAGMPKVTISPNKFKTAADTITAQIQGEAGYTYDVRVEYGGTLPEGMTVSGAGTQNVTVTVDTATYRYDPDTYIQIVWTDTDGTESGVPYYLNFDMFVPMDPQIQWEYGEGYRTGNVTRYTSATAVITDPNWKLTDIDTGMTPSCTFLYGDTPRCTITVQNSEGIQKDILVQLPEGVELVEPPVSEKNDKTPPSAQLLGFGAVDADGNSLKDRKISLWIHDPDTQSVNVGLKEYANVYYDNPVAFMRHMGWATRYRFVIESADQNNVRRILKNGLCDQVTYEDKSDVIDGVTLSGPVLDIRKNGSYTLFLVDPMNNFTRIPLMAENLSERPEPVVRKESAVSQTGAQSIRVFLEEPEDSAGNALLSQLKITEKTVQTDSKGRQYMEYTKNGPVSIPYSADFNGAAITGTVQTDVVELDLDAPHMQGEIKWSANGFIPTKQDVNAQIFFDRTITEVKLQNCPKEHTLPVAVQAGDNQISLLYRDNCPALTLECYGSNGRMAVVSVPEVSNIDRAAPEIQVSQPVVDPVGGRTAEVKFTPNEDVILQETDRVYSANHEYTYTVKENNTFVLNFMDKAGNEKEASFSVADIVTDELQLEFATTQNSETGSTTPPEGLKAGDTVYVRANRKCTISINGDQATEQLFDGSWVKISITEDLAGFCPSVYGIDQYGNAAVVFLDKITPLDQVPPRITVEKEHMYVLPEESEETVRERLMGNVLAYDTVDGEKVQLEVTFSRPADSPEKTVEATAVYTAKDQVGNQTEAQVQLHYLSTTDTQVLVNDQFAPVNEIVDGSLTGTDVKVKIHQDEPFRLVWKKGIRALGQMKIGVAQVEPDAEGIFHMPFHQPGYYTVCVITQGREFYRILVYVE